ncbi:lipoate--protein ligase [Haladaptatus sp. R4]|uniref:lipoyl protein ligase domain-containing protein n=1 Tax=Haladaptatus sp. R4 TaxID=1679489 RepID=UPI0007B47758|nr:lipoate--protein ligase family protein [Haladaptatus sp. R4]KZN24776.1 lipoate--protein ligase [Haladaptatus sp. R4]
MRVLRGQAETRDEDRQVTAAMLTETADTEESAVRVWTPHRQVAFGRRDTRAEKYDVAKSVARACGFEPLERSVGGRAVAYTGTTVAFAKTVPLADMRTGMEKRYAEITEDLQRAFWRLGVPAQRGEPERSFCPGDYSLQWKGKVAGVAQRVRTGAALVSGVVIVDDHGEIAGVLDPIYSALDVPFNPDSVGSIAKVDGDSDPKRVVEIIEEMLVGGADVTVEHVDRGI